MPPKKASLSTANTTPEDPEEPRVMIEEVVPEVEQLQETMGVFQEEMAQFNARQKSFAEEIVRPKAKFERQRQEMNAREEAD